MTFDDLFALTSSATDTWTAQGAPQTDERVVFGGLVVGQAIVAASVGTRRCHALHAFFIGGGEKQKAFQIAVERTRDGGTFDTRHVQIRQGERLLLAAITSHHDGDEGPEHQLSMPEIPLPESLEDFVIARRRREAELQKPLRHYLAESMLDVRHADSSAASPPRAGATHAVWFRARKPIRGGPVIHQAAIAFASDVPLVHVGLKNHARPADVPLQTASLDHSLWFHREAAADEWLLYVLQSPVARSGRGLSLGSIFNRQGELVASVAQEFLARLGRPRPEK